MAYPKKGKWSDEEYRREYWRTYRELKREHMREYIRTYMRAYRERKKLEEDERSNQP